MGPYPSDPNFDNFNTNFGIANAIGNIVNDVNQNATINFGTIVGGMIAGQFCGSFGAVGNSVKNACTAFGAAVGGAVQNQFESYYGNNDGSTTVIRSDMNVPNATFLGKSDNGDRTWSWQGATLTYNATDEAGSLSSLKFNGTAKAEAVSGSNAVDKLWGEGGGDWLKGWGGKDRLYGGTGDDRLAGGDGVDFLQDDAGSDYMHGGAGADTFNFVGDDKAKFADVADDFEINKDHVNGLTKIVDFKIDHYNDNPSNPNNGYDWYSIASATDDQGNTLRIEDAPWEREHTFTLAEVRADIADWIS